VSGGGDSDVSSGLNELETKLRELERAFSTLGQDLDAPPPAAGVTPLRGAPDPVVALAPPAHRDDVQDQIDELVRSQERLTATMQALVEDVSRVVDGLAAEQAAAPAATPAPAPIAAPAPAPASPPVPGWEPPPAALHVAAPLIPYEEPTPAPVARSVRDYLPNPSPPHVPDAEPAADDGG
jgi:hypothetical protein